MSRNKRTRVWLGVFSCLFALTMLFAAATAFRVIPVKSSEAFFGFLTSGKGFLRFLTGFGFVLVACFTVYETVISAIGVREKKLTIPVETGDGNGSVSVSSEAIKSIVSRCVNNYSQIAACNCTVSYNETDGAWVKLNISVTCDDNVAVLSNAVRAEILREVLKVAGITLQGVSIVVDDTVKNGKKAASSERRLN